MGLIKYFFSINSRGNPIINRGFLAEASITIVETFYDKISSNDPPASVFYFDGLNYAYIYENSLYFVVATEESMSPSLLLELLSRVVSVIKDYAGKCTEISIQQNLGLVYEIIDEVLSFGCPQATDSSNLLHLVHNTVSYEENLEKIDLLFFDLAVGDNYNRPLAMTADKRNESPNEVFFVLDERIEMLLTMNNQPIRSTITGIGSVKSFLKGQPSILIQLDPQMTVSTRSIHYNSFLKYDDIVFAPFVQTTSFDSDRTITFSPPEGESTIFKYRTSRIIEPPFTITHVFENKQAKAIVLRLSIQSQYPADEESTDVQILFQCPVEISNASCELPPSVVETQSSDFDSKTRQVIWKISSFKGLQEYSARFRFIFDDGIPISAERILGPISLKFVHVGKLPSGLSVQNYIVSTSGSQSPPKRWIKEISSSTCYSFNLI